MKVKIIKLVCLQTTFLTFAAGLNLNIQTKTSRRNAIGTISSIASAQLFGPQCANAATPLTPQEADNNMARLERKLRKPPPKVLRLELNLDFAVCLMRSSYNAVDELDFVAMDQFQKDFFLIRQAEYLPYVNELGPGLIKQGELTNPYYFDFISYAQYATIFRDISNDPAVMFEEQQPVTVGEDEPQQFVSKVIRRDPSISTSVLVTKHDELVGTKILDRLIEKFGETASAIPTIIEGSRPDALTLLRAIQQLVNLFIISGFALDGKVVLTKEPKSISSGSGAQFEITLSAPATLWSGRALASKRADTVNDFVLKTAKILISRSGYKVSSSSLKYTNTQEISTITII